MPGRGSSSKKQLISIGCPSLARTKTMVWKPSWTRASTSESRLSTSTISVFVCLMTPMNWDSSLAHRARPDPWCGVPRKAMPRVERRMPCRCGSVRCLDVNNAYSGELAIAMAQTLKRRTSSQTSPPRLWQTNRIGRSFYSRQHRTLVHAARSHAPYRPSLDTMREMLADSTRGC